VNWLAEYTLAGIAKALHRLKIRRKRGRLSVTSPDPAYRVKLALIGQAIQQARRHPERIVLVYGDEYSLYRQPTLGDLYQARGSEPRARLSQRANTRHRYVGFLEWRRGEVTWTDGFKAGVAVLCRGLAQLRGRYPVQRLFLVWDNWPVHQHPTVLSRASELGVEILWLPTYAPWTNPIEKLWRKLVEDLLRHHRLADRFDALRQQVEAFLDHFATGPPTLLRYVGLLSD
jgi:putative transposase